MQKVMRRGEKQVGHTAGTISNNETRKVKLDTVHMEQRANKIKL